MPTTTAPLSDLATTLREARERAGLTQRGLAEAMGVSRATVAEAELGSDVRASTLQRALGVLVGASPGRLLTGIEGAPPVHSQAVWQLQARLCGFVVRRVVRALGLSEGLEGELLSLAALGVRPLVGSLEDSALRRALVRAVYRGGPEALNDALERGGDEPGSELAIDEGERRHLFRFPAELDAVGFDYERHEPLAEACSAEGFVSFTPGYAIETLELALESGSGPLPPGAHYEAHAGGRRGDADGRSLADALRPNGVTPRRGKRTKRMSAEIARPEAYVTHEWHADELVAEAPPRDLRAGRSGPRDRWRGR